MILDYFEKKQEERAELDNREMFLLKHGYHIIKAFNGLWFCYHYTSLKLLTINNIFENSGSAWPKPPGNTLYLKKKDLINKAYGIVVMMEACA